MKNSLSFLSCHLLGLASLFALGASSMAATVTEDFSGPYPGGGSGWVGEWKYRHFRTTAPDSKAEVRDTNPLPGSENYLNVRFTRNVSSSGPYSIISRPFDTTVVDNGLSHRVTFDFRLDYATHWNNVQERIAIFAASQDVSRALAYDATSTNTWGIIYDGLNGWTIVESDGAGGIRTISPESIFKSAADASTVYSITLDIDPVGRTFTVSISDGDRTETWNNNAFNFINPSASASGNFLHFYAESRNGVTVDYSVANIRIEQIPEPGSVALAGGAVVAIGLGGLLRRSRSKAA